MKEQTKLITATLLIAAALSGLTNMVSNFERVPMQLSLAAPDIDPATETGGYEIDVEIPDATFAFPIAADDWYVTSPKGIRISPIYHVYRDHQGVDISIKDPSKGMPQVVSIADGVIRDNWITHPTRGKWIVIDHDNGMVSSSSHLSESFIHERRADGSPWRVKAGEPIGRMGATGLADGAHLHFEIEIEGKRVNPMLYLDEYLPEWEPETEQPGNEIIRSLE